MYLTFDQVLLVSDKKPLPTDHVVYVKETSNGHILIPDFAMQSPPYLCNETLQRYGALYLDARDTFCVIPDVWSEQDAMIAKGWR